MQNTVTQKMLHTLDKVKELGYIHPKDNSTRLYYERINHSLAEFFKATPLNPKDALACMEGLNLIGKNTNTFFDLFPKVIIDLYDWAVTGDIFERKQAETQLLFFFMNTAPHTIEQKNRLLRLIQEMPDFSERTKEIARVTDKLVTHYDQNQQFNEDPGLSVLKSLSHLLHKMNNIHFLRHSTNGINRTKKIFHSCSDLIRTYAPKLYEDLWQTKFTPRPSKKYVVPEIKEAADISTLQNHCFYG